MLFVDMFYMLFNLTYSDMKLYEVCILTINVLVAILVDFVAFSL